MPSARQNFVLYPSLGGVALIYPPLPLAAEVAPVIAVHVSVLFQSFIIQASPVYVNDTIAPAGHEVAAVVPGTVVPYL